jgi:hypothetical protein
LASLPVPMLVDERARLKGQPGLHAFIVGISAYPHLPKESEPDVPEACGLRQLPSAALTAVKMVRWLTDRRDHLAAPLATCRVLLAAQPAEAANEKEVRDQAGEATFAAFSAAAKEWRIDAASHSENVTFFYFAGHGVKRERGDHVLILQNFGDGVGGTLAGKAVNIVELIDGMAPSKGQLGIARTQLYVFDACRTTPDTFADHQIMQTGGIWDVEKDTTEDDRVRPLLFSAVPGAAAYADQGGTLFGRALLECLKGGAAVLLNDDNGDASWAVSLDALPRALEYQLRKINRSQGGNQRYEISLSGNSIIQRLDAPPAVDITLRVIPPEAAVSARVSLRDEFGELIRNERQLDPHPFPDTVPAGRYVIEARDHPPGAAGEAIREFNASPPFANCCVRLKAAASR